MYSTGVASYAVCIPCLLLLGRFGARKNTRIVRVLNPLAADQNGAKGGIARSTFMQIIIVSSTSCIYNATPIMRISIIRMIGSLNINDFYTHVL